MKILLPLLLLLLTGCGSDTTAELPDYIKQYPGAEYKSDLTSQTRKEMNSAKMFSGPLANAWPDEFYIFETQDDADDVIRFYTQEYGEPEMHYKQEAYEEAGDHDPFAAYNVDGRKINVTIQGGRIDVSVLTAK